MDQLKKVLEHKFWIMLALAIIIPFVGWGMTHSAMVAEFEKGKSELEGKFNGIPKGNNLPNASWSEGSTAENKKQRASVDETWQSLFDQQQKAKRWPPNFPTDLDQIDTVQQNTLLAYPRLYDVEVKRVYALVRPLNETATEGVVDFPFSSLPIVDFSAGAPTKRQILSAQEDLWLYEGLLRAIDRVNAAVDKQFDAPIPVLEELRLLGGSGGPKAGGASGPAANPMAAAGAAAGLAMPMSPMAGQGGDAIGATGGGGGADFDPADEFGPEVDDPTAATASPTGSAPPAGAGGMGANAMAMPMSPLGGGNNGGNSNSIKDRYVRKTENWNTRGFYMRVIMDHTEVPHLLAELSNSKEWPIRITRVQTDDVDKEDLSAAGGGQSGRTMGMGAGGMTPPGASGFRPPVAAPMGGGAKFGNPIRSPMSGGDDGEMVRTTGGRNYDNTKVAYVAISGEICIYKRPKNVPAPTGTPVVAPPPPVAVAPVADPAAATVPATAPGAVPAAVTAPVAVPAATPATAAGQPMETKPVETKPVETKPGEPAPAGEAAKTPPVEAPKAPADASTTPSPAPATPAAAPATPAPAPAPAAPPAPAAKT